MIPVLQVDAVQGGASVEPVVRVGDAWRRGGNVEAGVAGWQERLAARLGEKRGLGGRGGGRGGVLEGHYTAGYLQLSQVYPFYAPIDHLQNITQTILSQSCGFYPF